MLILFNVKKNKKIFVKFKVSFKALYLQQFFLFRLIHN